VIFDGSGLSGMYYFTPIPKKIIIW